PGVTLPAASIEAPHRPYFHPSSGVTGSSARDLYPVSLADRSLRTPRCSTGTTTCRGAGAEARSTFRAPAAHLYRSWEPIVRRRRGLHGEGRRRKPQGPRLPKKTDGAASLRGRPHAAWRTQSRQGTGPGGPVPTGTPGGAVPSSTEAINRAPPMKSRLTRVEVFHLSTRSTPGNERPGG